MKSIKIAVIGGGSSYTPELIDGFIKRKDELNVGEIYLSDIKGGEEKLNIVGNLGRRMLEKAGLKTKIILTMDRRKAIKDADFVITQFRVGGLKARARDEHIPLKYNVLGQETTGAGGFAKAMRTIPVIKSICDDIEELAPDAWLINFTNPAGVVTEFISRYTNVKAIGLCNVPINMKNTSAKLLDVDVSRVKMSFVGLNHLSWAKEITLDGKDVTREVIEKSLIDNSVNMKNIPGLDYDRDYLLKLNMLPSPYLRYYYATDEMVEVEQKDLEEGKGTRADQVMIVEKELFEIYKDLNLDTKPEQLEKRGGAYYSDAAVSLISAIKNDKKEVHTVNIVNNGSISNLDKDIVVECNALIDNTGARPITSGEVPITIKGIIEHVKAFEILTAKAAITKDYSDALTALSTSPLIPSVGTARQILDDILEQNQEYLGEFKSNKY